MAIYLGDKQVAINNYASNASITVEPLVVTQNNTSYTAPTGKAYSPIDIRINSTDPLILGVLRPDAEQIQSYTYDQFIVADEERTLPAFSTSQTTICSAANLSPTVSLDNNNFNYYVQMRMLTIPQYNTDTIMTRRYEYDFSVYTYEIWDLPLTLPAIVNNNIYTSSNYITMPVFGMTRGLVWTNTTTLGIYAATTYMIHQTGTTPTVSNNVLTIKSPLLYFRGHSSNFPQAVYESITDIRRQYIIEVFRAPKNNLNIDGWGWQHEFEKILNNINNNNFVLT